MKTPEEIATEFIRQKVYVGNFFAGMEAHIASAILQARADGIEIAAQRLEAEADRWNNGHKYKAEVYRDMAAELRWWQP